MPSKKKPAKRISAKHVQATENEPIRKLPNAKPNPEVDEDSWGEDRLTIRQRKFIAFYLGESGGNATKAASLAGYRDDNYDSLRVTAHVVLTNANVQRVLHRELSKGFGSPDDVRASIAAIANGSAADYLEPGPDGKLATSLDRMAANGALTLINQIQEELIEVGGQASVIKRKLKLYDRLKALELLARMNGQLIERRDITSGGQPIKSFLDIDDGDGNKDSSTE